MPAEINEKITDRGNKSPPEVVYQQGDWFCINGEFTIASWDIPNYAVKCKLKTEAGPTVFWLPVVLGIFATGNAYIHPCDLKKEHEDYLIWKDQVKDMVYRPSDQVTYKLMLDPKFKQTGKYWLLNVPVAGHPQPRIAKKITYDDYENLLSKMMYKNFDGKAVRGRILHFTMSGAQSSIGTGKKKEQFFKTEKLKKKVLENESTKYDIRTWVDIEGIQFFIDYKVLKFD